MGVQLHIYARLHIGCVVHGCTSLCIVHCTDEICHTCRRSAANDNIGCCTPAAVSLASDWVAHCCSWCTSSASTAGNTTCPAVPIGAAAVVPTGAAVSFATAVVLVVFLSMFLSGDTPNTCCICTRMLCNCSAACCRGLIASSAASIGAPGVDDTGVVVCDGVSCGWGVGQGVVCWDACCCCCCCSAAVRNCSISISCSLWCATQ